MTSSPVSPDVDGSKAAIRREKRPSKFSETWKGYKKCRYLFLLLTPVLLWYVVFAYGPLYGIQLAFKDFKMIDGVWSSPWVGVKHFEFLFFQSPDFFKILRNTIIISFYHIIFGFPAPIVLALLINEIRLPKFKKITQSLTYLPHFFSWVILSGILITLLSPSTGVVNYLIQLAGLEPIYFVGDPNYFRFTLVTSGIWKEVGWGTIIYLAALAGISPDLYEAAVMDGANRWKQTLHITLPSILPVIVLLFILRLGSVLDAGFDQVLNLYSPATYEVADILDTYVYRVGLQNFQFSLTTAVGLFKNVVAFCLVLFTNFISKKLGQEGLF
ncbi:sugar ABC transporter permease [Paenibacillus oralis]|uniref:Sugar ABC transporter permease n=1 Tax=Paenibacillus oralis TaxID=2490856 RepID=A0A3P3U7U5_9BACL|nr:ABC transporter permease subunit [Paenibacillus oralis]RRJ64553.1 sugar ABC transporter permease [Paenibacillus oralis]